MEENNFKEIHNKDEEEHLFIDIKLDDKYLNMVRNKINKIVANKKNNGLILLELPTDTYSGSNAISLKMLLEKGYEGIYISFQRPYPNVISWFKENEIDTDKISIIDGTDEELNRDNPGVTELYKNDDIEQLSKKISSLLQNIDSDKKFVFIDSITTISLSLNESWANTFSEFLINSIKNKEYENITFIVNAAKELNQKKIVRTIASHADGVIDFSNPKGWYSTDIMNSEVCT